MEVGLVVIAGCYLFFFCAHILHMFLGYMLRICQRFGIVGVKRVDLGCMDTGGLVRVVGVWMGWDGMGWEGGMGKGKGKGKGKGRRSAI